MGGTRGSAEGERPRPRDRLATPPATRARPPLSLVVFVVGAASLGSEIGAARLLAPYFGASTTVWANTIAVVLLALSTGYWLGGSLADKLPNRRHLHGVVLAAAVALAVVPFVARPFLSATVSALDATSTGAVIGSLVGVLLLVAGPVMLLGAVAPYAIRLATTDIGRSGTTAGRLYAISTAGSLVGTFLAALVLLPFAGTQRTFLVFAAALAAVACLGLRRRYALAALGVAALIAIPPGQTKAAPPGERVIWEDETPYQYARVVEDRADGDRRLELNEGLAVHSLYRPGSYLTRDYWDEFLVLPSAALPRPPRRVAILGNAGGTTARAYGHYFPATAIDGVEIDGELTGVARRFFDMRAPRLRMHTADARPFLRGARERYDAIFIDAYRQPYIPFYLATREFFDLARERLAAGGVVVVNVGHPPGESRLEKALAATMRAAFPVVLRDASEPTNTLLVGSAAPVSRGALARRARTLPPDLRPIAAAAARRLAPPLPGGEVLTDDRAPVEWLIDRSIVEYAAHGGR
jgi:spermidine synthase